MHAARLESVHADDAKQPDRLEVVLVIIGCHQFFVRHNVFERNDFVQRQVDEGVEGEKLLSIGPCFPVSGIRQRVFTRFEPGFGPPRSSV